MPGDLRRAYAALYRAIDHPRLGFVRDFLLCEAVGALDRAGERDLADAVAAAVGRAGGDDRDLDRALDGIEQRMRAAEDLAEVA